MNQHALRPQLVIYKEVQIFTDVDILSAGLSYAGFDAKRGKGQSRSKYEKVQAILWC